MESRRLLHRELTPPLGAGPAQRPVSGVDDSSHPKDASASFHREIAQAIRTSIPIGDNGPDHDIPSRTASVEPQDVVSAEPQMSKDWEIPIALWRSAADYAAASIILELPGWASYRRQKWPSEGHLGRDPWQQDQHPEDLAVAINEYEPVISLLPFDQRRSPARATK